MRHNLTRIFVTCCMALALLSLPDVASRLNAAEWPQFRGPRRDNISSDKGLLQEWPEGGPKLLWSSDRIGFGWGSTAVSGDRIYTVGVVGSAETVTSLDMDGQVKWQQKLEPPSPGGGYKGSRSTATVDGDFLYVLTSQGGLYCLETEDGAIGWKKNILSEYRAPQIRHSLAESVMIDGDRLICSPGGQAAMVALNKKTGEQIWAAPKIENNTSYTSALLVEHGGLRQIVNVSGNHIFGVNADDGRLLWKYEHKTPFEIHCNTPIHDDGIIYIVRGYKLGGVALKMQVDAEKGEVGIQRLWQSKTPDDSMGGTLMINGRIYGTGHQIRGLYCLDFKTGETVFERKEFTTAAITWADGRLYVQQYDGDIKLVDPSDGAVKGKFHQRNRRKELWAYPVVVGGRLYIRNESRLSVYDVRAAEEE